MEAAAEPSGPEAPAWHGPWTVPGTTLTREDVRRFAAELGVSRQEAERMMGVNRPKRWWSSEADQGETFVAPQTPRRHSAISKHPRAQQAPYSIPFAFCAVAVNSPESGRALAGLDGSLETVTDHVKAVRTGKARLGCRNEALEADSRYLLKRRVALCTGRVIGTWGRVD